MAFLTSRWERWGCPDWEHHVMTVGIAAICDSGRAVVLAADRQFSTGSTSGESKAGKLNNFGSNWYVAYAASNVPGAFEAIMTARPRVAALEDRVWHDVIPAIERAYQDVRISKAEALYLRSVGLTREDFYRTGKEKLPLSVFEDSYSKMRAYDLGATLLIVGFDDTSHIYTIDNPGTSKDHTGLGFWAIGSGAAAAIASLFARKCSMYCSLEEALYLVYEAKQQAQRATNVGDETDLYVLSRDDITLRIQDDEQKAILEPLWRELQPKEITTGHLSRVAKLNQIEIIKRLQQNAMARDAARAYRVSGEQSS
jgi:20S proteasome alpha/beta subunit